MMMINVNKRACILNHNMLFTNILFSVKVMKYSTLLG